MKKLKISIDFDGTLWSRMGFFRPLMFALQAAGHKVGMLTGHRRETEKKDIELMLSRGFPRPSFYFGRTPEFMHLNSAHFKSMIIQREQIDMHFDDYDYDNPETEEIFRELGQELKIARVKVRQPYTTHFE